MLRKRPDSIAFGDAKLLETIISVNFRRKENGIGIKLKSFCIYRIFVE